jgi:hypothetical protein
MSDDDKGHAAASRAAQAFTAECLAEGLSWEATMVACESFVAMVACYCALMSRTPAPGRWSREMLDTMMERAHLRVQEYLRSQGQ